MKKIVKRVRSSAHIQLIILGSILLLATLAVVAVSVRGNPPVQQKQLNPYKTKAPAPEKFAPVRMVPEALAGPVRVEGIDLPARVRALLPSVNALINNN